MDTPARAGERIENSAPLSMRCEYRQPMPVLNASHLIYTEKNAVIITPNRAYPSPRIRPSPQTSPH